MDYYSSQITKLIEQLSKLPGIGAKSAQRIVKARRTAALGFSDLKKIGVVLKRALYFITCSGKMMYRTKLDEDYIYENVSQMRN